jgi:hypothetical protein
MQNASSSFDLVGLLVFASVPTYFIVQAWLVFAWQGGWRIAALVPLMAMTPAVLLSVIALSNGSNLWPLVVILSAPFAMIYLAFVWATHAIAATYADGTAGTTASP